MIKIKSRDFDVSLVLKPASARLWSLMTNHRLNQIENLEQTLALANLRRWGSMILASTKFKFSFKLRNNWDYYKINQCIYVSSKWQQAIIYSHLWLSLLYLYTKMSWKPVSEAEFATDEIISKLWTCKGTCVVADFGIVHGRTLPCPSALEMPSLSPHQNHQRTVTMYNQKSIMQNFVAKINYPMKTCILITDNHA